MPDAGIPVFPRDRENDGESPSRWYYPRVELFRAVGSNERGDGVVGGIVVHPQYGVVHAEDYGEVEFVSEGAGQEAGHVEARRCYARVRWYLDFEHPDFGGACTKSGGAEGADGGGAGGAAGGTAGPGGATGATAGPCTNWSVCEPREIYKCYRRDKNYGDDGYG